MDCEKKGNTYMEDAEDLQAQQTAITQLIKMRGTEVLKTPSLAKSIMADLTRNKQKDAVPAFYTMLEEMNSGKSFSDEQAAQKFLSMIEKSCAENGLEIPHDIIVAKEKIKIIAPEDDTTQKAETQENTAEPQVENTTHPQATPQAAKKSNAGIICIVIIAVVFLGYMFVIKPQQEVPHKVAVFLRYINQNELAESVMKIGVNAKGNYGKTALMCAASENNIDIAKLLIQAGADVNAKNNDGWTALMYTALVNSDTIAKLLIQAGADINAKDDNERTALMFAANKNSSDVAKLLISDDADINAALVYAATFNSCDVAQLLINAKADINAKYEDGKTALMYALIRGNIDIVKLLIQAGADVNAKDNNGWSALTFAIVDNHYDAVQILIQAGADVNAIDNYVKTALSIAEGNGHTQMAQLLRNAGATY